MKNTQIIKIVLVLLLLVSSFDAFSWTEPWDENKKGWSSLMRAVYNKKYEKVERLIAKGKDINHKSQSGVCAFEIAVRIDDDISASFLINSCRLIISDSSRYFLRASHGGNLKLVQLLFDQGFCSKSLLLNNELAMAASIFGSPDVLQFLINQGINTNSSRTIDGLTPLMGAVLSGSLEKVRILIDSGADKSATSKNGLKPIDYIAHIKDNLEITEKEKNEIRVLLSQ
jgi:ankyrin repeat protein